MKPWSCPRCKSRLALIDYCDDGLTLVCSHCGYATSPTLVCPNCGHTAKAEECLRTESIERATRGMRAKKRAPASRAR